MKLHKVTMTLTEQDIERVNIFVDRLDARNKATAVSNALAITDGLTKRLANGDELLIRKGGSLETVFIPGMNR